MIIKKIKGEIIKIIELSSTAKELIIKLSEPMEFLPGSFVNVFLDITGENVRRAYSISSSSDDYSIISLTIRLSPNGSMTRYIWNNNMIGRKIDLMGPLGLNTVDKMNHDKAYLFAFGIGVGVVKSISYYLSNIKKVSNLTIITGSRNEEEILYQEYFNNLKNNSKDIKVQHVVSKIKEGSTIPQGYIQDYINNLDFNNSDVYVCGQEKACNDLVSKINSTNPNDCSFFIEGFH